MTNIMWVEVIVVGLEQKNIRKIRWSEEDLILENKKDIIGSDVNFTKDFAIY